MEKYFVKSVGINPEGISILFIEKGGLVSKTQIRIGYNEANEKEGIKNSCIHKR